MHAPCPTCRAKVPILRGLLAMTPHLRCPACGARIRQVETLPEMLVLAAVIAVGIPLAVHGLLALRVTSRPITTVLAAGVLVGLLAEATALGMCARRLRRGGAPSRPLTRPAYFAALAAALLGAFLVAGFAIRSTPGVRSILSGGVAGLMLERPAMERGRHGTVVGPWTFPDLDGRAVDFASFRGRTLFLNIWATWCPPCVAELPSIGRLADSLAGTDVAFVLLSDESPGRVKAFAAERGLRLRFHVFSGDLPAALEGGAIPRTYVIDPRGEVVFAHVGGADWDTDEVRRFLREGSR